MSQPDDSDLVVVTEGLRRSFGDVDAVAGIDLEVPRGTVLGLLGPNGAGKTTTVQMLATLVAPSGGRARVGGYDVATQARQVRSIIGLTGQYAAVDEHLTGRENLELFAELLGSTRPDARLRAADLLERFGLADAADRRSSNYSGGMRRRLDLAASLLGHPHVVFLDEPTTGLDPRSRLQLWDVVKGLVAEGTTILLTTQYLEEADQLADDVVVIDHGTVVARGTPAELKGAVGGQVVEIDVESVGAAEQLRADLLLAGITVAPATGADSQLVARVTSAAEAAAAVAVASNSSAQLRRLDVHDPSLDDVFLALTGSGDDDIASQPTLTATA